MLSSFINRRKNAKKISLFEAAIRRVQSPSSSASSHDTHPPERNQPSTKGDILKPLTLPLVQADRGQGSPQVFLDLKDGFSDWFPHEILNGQGGDGYAPNWSDGKDAVLAKRFDFAKAPSVSFTPSNYSGSINGDSQDSDASPDINDTPILRGSISRKPTPSPLKIPNIIREPVISRPASKRATERVQKFTQQSRPSSIATNDDTSAISGTTLARALIANSFILSSDASRSRYRSGVVQQDSATLPGVEHGIFHSPYRRSYGEFSSESSSPVPPVPPLPQTVDISPSADFIHISNNGNSLQNSKRPRSLPSRSSHRNSSGEGRNHNRKVPRNERRSYGHRTSRASSNISAVPSVPGLQLNSARGSPRLLKPPTKPLGPAPFRGKLSRPRSPETAETSPTPSERVPGTRKSAKSADSIHSDLLHYESDSPVDPSLNSNSRSHSPPHVPELSPGSTVAKSSASIVTPPLTVRPLKRVRQSRELAFNETFVEPGVTRSPLSRRVSERGLLPIGNRSAQTSPSKSRPSEGSADPSARHHSIKSSGAPTPDLLDSMFLPQRTRPFQPTRPDPISIHNENLNMSDVPDSSNVTSYSTDGQQTFPETPEAFSPLLWSASSTLKSSVSISDFLSPGTPRSDSLHSPGLYKGARKLTLRRAVTLGRKRLPLRSIKPEMSPIPSTPTPLLPLLNDNKGDNSSGQTASYNDFFKLNVSSPSSAPGVSGVFVTIPEQHSREGSPGPSSAGARSNAVSSPIPKRLSNEAHTSLSAPNHSDRKIYEDIDSATARLPTVSPGSRPSSENKRTKSPVTEFVSSIEDVTAGRLSPKTNLSPQTELAALEDLRRRSRSISPGIVPRTPEALEQLWQLFPSPPQPPKQSPPLLPPQPLPEASVPVTVVDILSPVQDSHPSVDGRTAGLELSKKNLAESSHPRSPRSHQDTVEPTFSIRAPEFTRFQSPKSSSSTLDRAVDSSISKLERTEQPLVTVIDHPETTNRRRRPPLPNGPRKPSSASGSSLIGVGSKNTAVSSTSTTLQGEDDGPRSRNFSPRNADQRPHRFQTTPIRWRGLPLDVAKWTFTSEQLQQLVSRAIKQSAEASSVRLLKAEVLDHELPEEIHRLELLTTDIKARYKMFVGRRRELLNRLSCHADGGHSMSSRAVSRVIEELADASENIEQLAEELYNVTDQLAQLKRLCDVHSGSALSVALKKLYSTFIRQAAELQLQEDRVATLEAERDACCTRTEGATTDSDDLTSRGSRGEYRMTLASNSRHASQIAKPIGGLKIGFRSSRQSRNRPQLRRTSTSSLQSNSATVIRDRRRPPLIQTHTSHKSIHSIASAGALYSELMTPSSESVALAKAQKELCDMLGISIKDLRLAPRRAYSICSLRRRTASPGLKRVNSDNRSRVNNRERYLYLDPASSDGEIMLATLGHF